MCNAPAHFPVLSAPPLLPIRFARHHRCMQSGTKGRKSQPARCASPSSGRQLTLICMSVYLCARIASSTSPPKLFIGHMTTSLVVVVILNQCVYDV